MLAAIATRKPFSFLKPDQRMLVEAYAASGTRCHM
jgi:hypothetical protein